MSHNISYSSTISKTYVDVYMLYVSEILNMYMDIYLRC